MNEWGILAIYISFLMSLPLFFVKRERTRKILLYTSLFLLAGGLVSSVTDFLWPPYENIQASRYVDMLIWHAGDLKYIVIPAIIALIFVAAANRIAKRRIVKRLPSLDPRNQSHSDAWIRLQKSTPMFGTFPIITIVFASLFGIAMLVFAREVMIEKYWFGPSVDLPATYYGKCISYNCENIIITMGPKGELSTREGTLSLEELRQEIARVTAEIPLITRNYMDTAGVVKQDEFIGDLVVHLRVDENCQFEKVKEVLAVLESQKIRYGWFRVVDNW